MTDDQYEKLIIADDFDGIKNAIENQTPIFPILFIGKNEFAASYYNVGNMASRCKKHNLAIKLYEEAIKYRPQDASIYNNIGTEYKRKGEYDKAENYYLKSLSVNSEYISAYLRLALLKAYLGKKEEALRNFDLYMSNSGEHHRLYAKEALKSNTPGGLELNELIKNRIDEKLRAKKWEDLYKRYCSNNGPVNESTIADHLQELSKVSFDAGYLIREIKKSVPLSKSGLASEIRKAVGQVDKVDDFIDYIIEVSEDDFDQ